MSAPLGVVPMVCLPRELVSDIRFVLNELPDTSFGGGGPSTYDLAVRLSAALNDPAARYLAPQGGIEMKRRDSQAAPPPGESVELEVQWRTLLIDGKLYPIVTLPDGWTGRVRVTCIKEEKEGVAADSGPHGDTPPPSLLRAYRDLPIVAPASAEARIEEEK